MNYTDFNSEELQKEIKLTDTDKGIMSRRCAVINERAERTQKRMSPLELRGGNHLLKAPESQKKAIKQAYKQQHHLLTELIDIDTAMAALHNDLCEQASLLLDKKKELIQGFLDKADSHQFNVRYQLILK